MINSGEKAERKRLTKKLADPKSAPAKTEVAPLPFLKLSSEFVMKALDTEESCFLCGDKTDSEQGPICQNCFSEDNVIHWNNIASVDITDERGYDKKARTHTGSERVAEPFFARFKVGKNAQLFPADEKEGKTFDDAPASFNVAVQGGFIRATAFFIDKEDLGKEISAVIFVRKKAMPFGTVYFLCAYKVKCTRAGRKMIVTGEGSVDAGRIDNSLQTVLVSQTKPNGMNFGVRVGLGPAPAKK